MSVTIRGTDTSAAAPSFTGTDSDTGLFFPTAGQAAIATNGSQALLVDEAQSVRINGASASTADSKLNTQVTSAGSLITLAELRNNDFTAGTRSFLRVRNAVSGVGSGSAYFGQGQDNNTYIIANNSARGGDIVINGSLGTVNMPSQPMASVYSSSSSGVTGSVGTVLAFDQEQVDVGGNYNTSTYRFTAPVAGKYFATLWLLGRNSTSAYCAGFYKNGSQIQGRGAYIEAGSGNEVQGLQTLIINCAAGDYIDARITQTGNGDLYLGDLAGMQFYLIG